MTPRIDAHQHFWRIARGDYAWLTPALGAIYRDFNPDDLAPHLAAHGIAATILVQAAPTDAETAFLLDLADKTAFVAGVVGWTEFAAPDADATIARLAADPLLVGLRPMVQDMDDDDWLTRAELAPAFDAMIAHHWFSMRCSSLGICDGSFPCSNGTLSCVSLSIMRPSPRSGAALVRHGGATSPPSRNFRTSLCKLSGLVTEAPANWTVDDLRPMPNTS